MYAKAWFNTFWQMWLFLTLQQLCYSHKTFSVFLIALQFTSPPVCPSCAQTVICILLDNEWQWMVDSLSGWLFNWFVDWLTDWLVKRQADWLIRWRAVCVTAASTKRLTEQRYLEFQSDAVPNFISCCGVFACVRGRQDDKTSEQHEYMSARDLTEVHTHTQLVTQLSLYSWRLCLLF